MCNYENNEKIIDVSTTHIWERNDEKYSIFESMLSQLCKREMRSVFVHEKEHEISRLRDRKRMKSVIEIIRRMMKRTLRTQ